MRTVKSVLIVTRMGYVEGVFTSFRALANSQGATRINIEGEYESYTEPEPMDITANGKTFTYFGKNLKQITMKKIEKYVVFKYEDEFGFHYMKMDKLPGGDLHTWSPSRSRRRSTPTVPREPSLNSRFQRTENLPMCSAQNLSPCLVSGTTKPKFGNGRKGPGSIRLSRS